jgi:AraC family transcriptional regulator
MRFETNAYAGTGATLASEAMHGMAPSSVTRLLEQALTA